MFAIRPPSVILPAFALLLLATVAGAQAPDNPGDRENQGLEREQMWHAPTEADWKKPCLITWQRTWEDALAVSKETGKAILICVNMDGEIASEHYAGVRYRQPEVAKLYEPYVCVVASTYRHTPRDYDEQGRRIVCPRFGQVTCGEHIAIEPILYEKYFDGQRVAPRHIMIELDGKEQYDVFFTWDTASVFDAVHDGIAKRAVKPKPIVRGDRSIVERVASRDIVDREATEAAYRDGDAAVRRSLLEAAKKQGGAAPLDVLRQAVFGLDVDLAKVARQTLSGSESPAATDLIAEALRVPMEPTEREALIGALERLGKTLPRAQWLAVVQRGLGGRSSEVDVAAWSRARAEYEASAVARDLGELDARRTRKAGALQERPDDGAACLELAEASLDLALKTRKSTSRDPRMLRVYTRHLLDDAMLTALRAEKLEGATAWRVNTVVALAAYYRGDVDNAYSRAEAAVKEIPPGEGSWNAMAVLALFAESRWEGIKKAMDAKRRFPPRWLTDVNAAYTALRRHPHGTDAQIVWHVNFLEWLGSDDQVTRVLKEGLERFADSPAIHARLRQRALQKQGVAGLEAVYSRMLQETDDPSPRLEWYAGYASIVAAEFHRRAGDSGRALAAYNRAIGRYARAAVADPSLKEAITHRLALAMAGRARVAYERGDDERALADVLASLEGSPGSAGTADGLGITPAATAQVLLARLEETEKAGLAAKLEAAIAKLDPELLPTD